MATATYDCVCGVTLRYKQDLVQEHGGRTRTWLCRACRTPVPAVHAEKIKHQHPS